MKSYVVNLEYGQYKHQVPVRAINAETARKMVMKSENCPEFAITSVSEIRGSMVNKEFLIMVIALLLVAAISAAYAAYMAGIDEGMDEQRYKYNVAAYCSSPGHNETFCHSQTQGY